MGILSWGRDLRRTLVLLQMGFSSINRWHPHRTDHDLEIDMCLLHLRTMGQVDYDKNFLFYMTTKMPNPHYFPEVCIKAGVAANCWCSQNVIHMDVFGANLGYRNGSWRNLALCMPLGCFECREQDVWPREDGIPSFLQTPQVTVINFTVTFEGLEEQLLNEVASWGSFWPMDLWEHVSDEKGCAYLWVSSPLQSLSVAALCIVSLHLNSWCVACFVYFASCMDHCYVNRTT